MASNVPLCCVASLLPYVQIPFNVQCSVFKYSFGFSYNPFSSIFIAVSGGRKVDPIAIRNIKNIISPISPVRTFGTEHLPFSPFGRFISAVKQREKKTMALCNPCAQNVLKIDGNYLTIIIGAATT